MFVTLWQDEHPQTPNYLVANAVRVEIEYEYPLILSPFGEHTTTIRAQSVVLADTIAPATVPPFALPVCALLNSNSEFDPMHASWLHLGTRTLGLAVLVLGIRSRSMPRGN